MNKTERLIGVVGYLESEVEESRIKIASIRRDLINAENELVGRKERLLHARECLRKHSQSVFTREVTLREVHIANMFNIPLVVGEKISNEEWAEVCSHRSS